MTLSPVPRKLFDAVCCGDLETTRALLAQGANVNEQDSTGQTPLSTAAYNGHLEIVRLLLDKHASVDTQDCEGRGPFIMAIFALRKGMTLSSQELINNSRAIIDLLLESGADINKGDRRKYTPLMWTAYFQQIELASLLIEKGADLNAVKEDGISTLDYAQANCPEIAEMIKKAALEKTTKKIARISKAATSLQRDLPCPKTPFKKGFK